MPWIKTLYPEPVNPQDKLDRSEGEFSETQKIVREYFHKETKKPLASQCMEPKASSSLPVTLGFLERSG